MIELLTVAALVGYIVYLRYYADPRSEADKQADQLREGIDLFEAERLAAALAYFNAALKKQPKLALAYGYRARIYRLLGDADAALTDLRTGLSYNDTLADLHLEIGQIHYEQADFGAALLDFDKAVFHGNQSEAYHWRGRVRQQLGQAGPGEQDLAKGEALLQTARQVLGTLPARPTRFLSRPLLVHAGFTLLNTVLLLVVIKNSTVIHLPYLVAVASAGAIGFAEPRKGWVLALGQTALLWLSYRFLAPPPTSGVVGEVELFSLYGAIGLTFAGSFLGGLLKRAQA